MVFKFITILCLTNILIIGHKVNALPPPPITGAIVTIDNPSSDSFKISNIQQDNGTDPQNNLPLQRNGRAPRKENTIIVPIDITSIFQDNTGNFQTSAPLVREISPTQSAPHSNQEDAIIVQELNSQGSVRNNQEFNPAFQDVTKTPSNQEDTFIIFGPSPSSQQRPVKSNQEFNGPVYQTAPSVLKEGDAIILLGPNPEEFARNNPEINSMVQTVTPSNQEDTFIMLGSNPLESIKSNPKVETEYQTATPLSYQEGTFIMSGPSPQESVNSQPKVEPKYQAAAPSTYQEDTIIIQGSEPVSAIAVQQDNIQEDIFNFAVQFAKNPENQEPWNLPADLKNSVNQRNTDGRTKTLMTCSQYNTVTYITELQKILDNDCPDMMSAMEKMGNKIMTNMGKDEPLNLDMIAREFEKIEKLGNKFVMNAEKCVRSGNVLSPSKKEQLKVVSEKYIHTATQNCGYSAVYPTDSGKKLVQSQSESITYEMEISV